MKNCYRSKSSELVFVTFLGIFCFSFISSFPKDVLVSLAKAAEQRSALEIEYDPSYYSISYPNGDVPKDKGVCSDVVIRSYRAIGVDLQKLIHEDMRANFSSYPTIWGLNSTDKNIDHRRVPNQMMFFERKGAKLGISNEASDYLPGDIVCWNLSGRNDYYGVTHVGVVTTKLSKDEVRYLIAHNIGNGVQVEDCLFSYQQIGHYRYTGVKKN